MPQRERRQQRFCPMASLPHATQIARNPGPLTADEERVVARILIRHGYHIPAESARKNTFSSGRTW
jgi:hypothetical protein